MYQNIYYNRNTKIVHLWDDEQGYIEIPYEPYAYKKHPNGEHTSLYGDKLKKIYNSEIENTSPELLFESDVHPEDRILIDLYKDSFDISKNHIILFLDIETRTEGGPSEPEDANQPIIAISYSVNGGPMTCLLLNQTNSETTKFEDGENKVILFDHESELLIYFVDAWKKIKPTIITHWNGDDYDVPYIINRITKVLSINKAKALSPINKIDYNKRDETYTIAGVSSLDYMRLYKKYTFIGKPSYSLDAISKEEIGRGKIKFTGGFTELFKDQKKTVEYVNEDVQLLIDLDKKLKLIELTLFICHDAHTAYDNVYSNSRILDNASILFLNSNGIIAPNRKPKPSLKLQRNHSTGEDKIYVDKIIDRKVVPLKGVIQLRKSKTAKISFEYSSFEENYFILESSLDEPLKKEWEMKIELPGAYVNLEESGLYDDTSSIDLVSLYPSIIMTLNMSPETKIGRVLNWEWEIEKLSEIKIFQIEFVGGMLEEFSLENFNKFIEERKVKISATGIMYDGTKKGFIPSILEKWFNHRVESKNLMKKYKKEGNEYLTQLYYTKQLTEKVKLNSFYGVLALSVFRFYDLDNAESVTATGQAIIKFSKKYINISHGEKTAIYEDTDSVYFKLQNIIKEQDLSKLSIDEFLNYTVPFSNNINEKLKLFSKLILKSDNNWLEFKSEKIIRTAFHHAKKRYALCVKWNEGFTYTEENTKEADKIYDKEGNFLGALAVTGLDIVRSDFPERFKEFMTNIVKKILAKFPKEDVDDYVIDFKTNLHKEKIEDILFPTGVSDVEKYKYGRSRFHVITGTPIHVKSALYYNDMLEYFNITNLSPVGNWDKIKWCYLKENPLQLEVMAIKNNNDNQKEIEEYILNYIDYDAMFQSKLQGKLQDFYESLHWGILPDRNTKKINSLFKF